MLLTQNNVFPFDISNAGSNALVVKGNNEPNLRYLCYGHLHINGLKLLRQKDMVVGLLEIGQIDLRERSVYGKQTRRSFLAGKSWRATARLEVVHADLYGLMKTESFRGSRHFLLFSDDYSRCSWAHS